ncbi:MAG: hypothetical protein WDM87_16455 [Terracidiphilus sp.]
MQEGDFFFERELLEDEVGAFVGRERLGFIHGREESGWVETGWAGLRKAGFWATETVDPVTIPVAAMKRRRERVVEMRLSIVPISLRIGF